MGAQPPAVEHSPGPFPTVVSEEHMTMSQARTPDLGAAASELTAVFHIQLGSEQLLPASLQQGLHLPYRLLQTA